METLFPAIYPLEEADLQAAYLEYNRASYATKCASEALDRQIEKNLETEQQYYAHVEAANHYGIPFEDYLEMEWFESMGEDGMPTEYTYEILGIM